MIDAGADTSGLPKNLEAEQALLGQIMYDNAVMERLPEGLRSEHFAEPYHQLIFETCLVTVSAGRTADPTLMASTLASCPAFGEYGGLRYLADMMDKAPPAASARDLARTIRDLSDRRGLIRVSGDIAASATDMTAPASDHLSNAESVLFSLAETGDQSKGIQSFRDAMSGAVEMIEAAYRRDGALSGLSTHLIDLDQKLGGLHPSDLLILAGRPSMGKTALATNIAYRVADAYEAVQDADAPRGLRTVNGGVVLFYSLEMSAEQLAMRIIADVAEVSGDKLRKGEIDANQFRRIKEVQARLAEIPLYIDATGGLPIAKLAARARRQKRKTGLDLIVVDYLQLITTGANAQKNRVQEVSEITGALKALAKDLGVPVLALSQLSRKVEEREDKRPQLSDLRESGSIEQDADAVMFVYREAYYLGRAEPKEGSAGHPEWVDEMDKVQGQAEVIIGKQRHGPIGTVRLSFDDDTTRFGNLAREGQYEARYPYGDA